MSTLTGKVADTGRYNPADMTHPHSPTMNLAT
jgi:hypothetical protein